MVSPAPLASNPVTPALAGPRQQAWFRALDRARLTGAKPTYSIATDSYRVVSPARATPTTSTQLDGRLTYECSCKAGEHGQVCWHAALIAALPGECSRRRAYRAQPAGGPHRTALAQRAGGAGIPPAPYAST
jgi:hypothetical protein